LISPAIYWRYNLPWLKAITQLTKEMGMISHQHTCGRSWRLIDLNYRETELDVMEPLEPLPGGDVDLAVAKQQFGDKFCLKGNINTFTTMLSSPDEVHAVARKCLEDAAAGGGYILSTGDQCGRDTPDENLYKLVEVVEKYGYY
jgi:uroporphyrinogen decarboxylase